MVGGARALLNVNNKINFNFRNNNSRLSNDSNTSKFSRFSKMKVSKVENDVQAYLQAQLRQKQKEL